MNIFLRRKQLISIKKKREKVKKKFVPICFSPKMWQFRSFRGKISACFVELPFDIGSPINQKRTWKERLEWTPIFACHLACESDEICRIFPVNNISSKRIDEISRNGSEGGISVPPFVNLKMLYSYDEDKEKKEMIKVCANIIYRRSFYLIWILINLMAFDFIDIS